MAEVLIGGVQMMQQQILTSNSDKINSTHFNSNGAWIDMEVWQIIMSIAFVLQLILLEDKLSWMEWNLLVLNWIIAERWASASSLVLNWKCWVGLALPDVVLPVLFEKYREKNM